jgi:hypothetical protein
MQDLNQVFGKRKIERKGKCVSRKICSLIITYTSVFGGGAGGQRALLKRIFASPG